MTSRREFIQQASAASLATTVLGSTRSLYAQRLDLPLGIQLYSVREQLARDYEGTLLQVGSLGYVEVEAAGFYKKSAKDVRGALDAAKLRCVSAHYGLVELSQQLDEVIAFAKVVGIGNIVCSSPGMRDGSARGGVAAPTRGHTLTLDDWRWNADQFNKIGEKVSAAGLRFGYHNHVKEFVSTGGGIPFVELLRRTDPARVVFELDCGWCIVAGAKPVDYLREYADRILMLHVKDFKLRASTSPESEPKVTELGMGSVDYRPIFQEASKAKKIKHMFVEQEAFDMPYMDSLKVDAEYMRKMRP